MYELENVANAPQLIEEFENTADKFLDKQIRHVWGLILNTYHEFFFSEERLPSFLKESLLTQRNEYLRIYESLKSILKELHNQNPDDEVQILIDKAKIRLGNQTDILNNHTNFFVTLLKNKFANLKAIFNTVERHDLAKCIDDYEAENSSQWFNDLDVKQMLFDEDRWRTLIDLLKFKAELMTQAAQSELEELDSTLPAEKSNEAKRQRYTL